MEAQSVITVLFVDRSVSDEQLVALERIYQSFNPLRPFIFLNVRRTEMSFISLQNGTAYEAEIPRVLQIKIQRQLDSQGEPLLQTAALDQFSNTIEYARNLIYKSWDEEGHLKWDFSGRQANFRRIDLDSDTYKNRMMLIQYTDGSGFFNETQLDLIRNLKLPTLPSYPTSSKPKSGSVILPAEADR